MTNLLYRQLYRKDENEKKDAGNGPFLKKLQFLPIGTYFSLFHYVLFFRQIANFLYFIPKFFILKLMLL